MKFKIIFRKSHLKVASSLITNTSAGLFLLLATIQNVFVLTFTLAFAILILILAVRVEDEIEKYD